MKTNNASDLRKTKPNKLVPSTSPLGASSGQALSSVEWNKVRNNAIFRKYLISQDRPDILYENETQQRS